MNAGSIMIRGMDPSYTAFMVNSVKQNTGQSRPYGHDIGTEANFLPPMEAIERIEVIRGPMSSLYGSDAIGGVVNVITKNRMGRKTGRRQLPRMHGFRNTSISAIPVK